MAKSSSSPQRIGKIPPTRLEKKSGEWIYCYHDSLIPIEYAYGVRRYNNSGLYIDWNYNVINAHVSRVTKLFCPVCGCQFPVNSGAEDKLPKGEK